MWEENYRTKGYLNETKVFNFFSDLLKKRNHIRSSCQSSDIEDKFRKWDFMILKNDGSMLYYDVKNSSSVDHFNFTYMDPSGRQYFEHSLSTDIIFINRNFLYFVKLEKLKEWTKEHRPSGKPGHDNTRYFTIPEEEVKNMSYASTINMVPGYIV